ncbi:MAG: hypothetical protein ACRD1Y_13910 [Terriglobales bacterium]
MATVAIAIAGGALEQRASASIDEASATVRLANSSLGHQIKLEVLARNLRKVNRGTQEIFDTIESSADAGPASAAGVEQYTPERIQALADQAFALYFLFVEIYRRCAAARLTNCSKFGIGIEVSKLQSLGEHLWGLGDWLQMCADPEIYEEKMQRGEAEIQRGEFERLS